MTINPSLVNSEFIKIKNAAIYLKDQVISENQKEELEKNLNLSEWLLSIDQKIDLIMMFWATFDNIKNSKYPKNAPKIVNNEPKKSKIDKINQSEKSRTVTIEGKEYTRSVSDIFATSKDFKNPIAITGKNSDNFKKKREDDNIKEVDYILWQDIINNDSKENLQLNFKIIQAIVSEQYNWSWFEFLKASGLVEFDQNTGKIPRSELTSYRDSAGDWHDGKLGHYGYIWLRAVSSNGNPICIRFNEGSAHWLWYYATLAMRVGSEKKSA